MKAIVTAPGGLDALKLVDLPDPGKPGRGEIRVALHGSSLNYHDLGVASGKPPTDGRVLMADGAGIVEEVGDDVTEFKPGDPVVSCFFPDWQDGRPLPGGFARTPGDGMDGFACEYAVRPATAFTRAPEGWSHVEAATITTAGLTAWRALVEIGRLRPGETVLALGTGGVSIFALQIAKAMGARVAITSSSDEKLERARALGADYTVNYKTDTDWAKKILEWTDGVGVDHTLEIGGPGTLGQSIQATRMAGSITLIGVLTGIQGDVPTAALMGKQITLSGLIVGSRRHQQDFVQALDAGLLKPVIDKTFRLEDLADAFRFEKSGSHFGKIGLEW